MSASNLIVDATPENFAELVIGNSMRGPVMVNFWSAKAGPCLKLWPVLEKLVQEYAGRFLLVNFNVEKYSAFARKELGITSVPTVRMYVRQQVVEVVHGAESENSFRTMLERHLPRASDAVLHDAVKLYQQGKVDEALDMMQALQQQDAENLRIPLTRLRLLFREGRLQEMLSAIGELAPSVQQHEDVVALATHADFMIAAQQAPAVEALQSHLASHANDLDALYQLSALHLVQDRYADAMDQLLQIIRIDRGYKNDIGVKGMVALLNMVGTDTDMARFYRQKMMDLIRK
jgi:putative thioredoxin